jgi:hypothetical protein
MSFDIALGDYMLACKIAAVGSLCMVTFTAARGQSSSAADGGRPRRQHHRA